jgi:hypothetical protein
METVYLWPDRPALSLLALWGISVVVLWTARAPMFELIERLAKSLEDALAAGGRACRASAEVLTARSRSALLAAGGLDLQGKLESEFRRIEDGFSERLGQYSGLQRRLDDLLQSLEHDWEQSGSSPPEVPGWTAALESIAGIPHADDPNVNTILEGVRKSLEEAQKKALHLYRSDTAERHGILDRMRSLWKEVALLQERMNETLSRALETASRINGYVDDYARVRNDDHAAARALAYSAGKSFAIALFVLGVASGCGYVSFQLIVVPCAELLPAASLFGVSLAELSAGVIVLVHIGLGIYVMDGVGVTELLPRLAALPAARRRRLLQAAFGALLLLAVIEGSLAGAQEGHGLGEQLLGFALPFLVALAALPLEHVLDSGRPVAIGLAGLGVSGVGACAFAAVRAVRVVANVLPSLYDVYVSVPLRIEGWLTSPRPRGITRPHPQPGA